MRLVLTCLLIIGASLITSKSHAETKLKLLEDAQGRLYIEADIYGRVRGEDGEMHEVGPDFYKNLGKKFEYEIEAPADNSEAGSSMDDGPKIIEVPRR